MTRFMKADGLAYVATVLAGLILSTHGYAEGSAAGLPVAGGLLDPSVTGVDVYEGTPVSVKAPPACRIGDTYLGLINSGQFDKIADLYADDAVLLPPIPHLRAIGHAEIDNFYRKAAGKYKLEIIAVAYSGSGKDCFQEQVVKMNVDGKPRYMFGTIDHFTFNSAGKIAHMAAFARPHDDSVSAPESH